MTGLFRYIHRKISLSLLLLPAGMTAQPDTTLPLPPVTVRNARFDQTGFSAWRADSLPISGAVSLSDRLLWENPLAVRANAPGTLATLSARGAGPSRTPVFWNGLNLQSPQHGTVDASLIPLWPGDRLEVRYGGQSAALSAGAMGGSVMVEPGFSLAEGFSGSLGGALGSFGRKEAQAALGFSRNHISAQGRVNWQRADNDFPFEIETLFGRFDTNQVNNRVDILDIQQFNRLIFNEKNTIKTVFWHQRAFREIPPSTLQAIAETWQRDRSTRAVASWENTPRARSLWQTRAAYADEAIHFLLAGKVDSSRARTVLLNTEYSTVAGRRLTWKTGGTAIRQWAQSDGYADSAGLYAQSRLAGFGMAEWRLKRGRLTALVRQEWAEKQAVPFTWSLGGQQGWGRAGELRFHLSRNFNLPTFNDRFWKALGEPDLKPEQGYSGDVGWVFFTASPAKASATAGTAPATDSLTVPATDSLTASETISSRDSETISAFTAKLTAFQLLIDDWIIWQPGADGIFRPGNLRKVWSRGIEINGNWKLEIGNWDFRISGHYQFLKTTNVAVYDGAENVLNKQLPYTSNHNAGAMLRVEKSWFSGVYFHQWTSRRYTTSDNSDPLPGFQTGSLLLRVHPTPGPSPDGRGDVERSATMPRSPRLSEEGPGVGWSLDFRLDNIWNTPYQITAYRPMPGRNWRIGVTIYWFD